MMINADAGASSGASRLTLRDHFVRPIVITFCACCVLASCASSAEKPIDPNKLHHTADGFRNLYIERKDTGFFEFQWMKHFGEDKWADYQGQGHRVARVDRSDGLPDADAETPTVTWLGHATVLVQYRETNILTDPIFSWRASPVSFAGPRRVTPPAVKIDQLPDIDIVLISHNHYDHLDAKTVEQLGDGPHWMVPLGYLSWFADQGVTNVSEYDWWDEKAHQQAIITATPSQHWTGRGLYDRYRQLWAAWSVKIGDFSFWFAGDTGYNNVQFREIGDRLGPFDLGLIPIGAYEPRWFMKNMHVNPEEAVAMHQDVRARLSVGIHWGAFPLTAEPIDEPPKRLAKVARELGDTRFISLALGESITVPLNGTSR